MRPYPDTPRHNAVAACCQWYGLLDPDTARTVAVYVIEALDRIEKRAEKEEAQIKADIEKAAGVA